MTFKEEMHAERNRLVEFCEASKSHSEVIKRYHFSPDVRLLTQLREAIELYNINIGHFKNFKKRKILNKTCPICETNFTTKSGSRETTYCSHKCGNIHVANVIDKEAKNAKLRILCPKKPLAEKMCKHCSSLYYIENYIKNSKYCSHSCAGKSIGFKEGHKIKSPKTGRAPVSRSKNEIVFADFCIAEYENVICNAKIFSGWDADVILLDQKIAVLWNGVWHYKENIRPGHSLAQVQSRDAIKLHKIEEMKFLPYIIKDMGKHNSKFVIEQFELFKSFVEDMFSIFT